ncbi:MAG: dihydrofolate reductase family protein [Archangium sp.]
MQPVVFHIATSVDGFIAGPGGAVDRFSYSGHHVTEYVAALANYSAVVMGRRTYQFGLDMGVSDPYPHLETFVFSRTLSSPNPRVTVVSGDVAPTLRKLREKEGKGVYLAGGGELAGQALAAGLVDELIIKVNPIVLGEGVPLFGKGTPFTSLELRSTKTHSSGVAVLHYDVKR